MYLFEFDYDHKKGNIFCLAGNIYYSHDHRNSNTVFYLVGNIHYPQHHKK